MTHAARTRLVLWAVAATATTLGALVMLLPVPGTVEAVAPSTPATPPSPPARVDPGSAAEDIVLTNVFSASRTAPRTRYAPPELAAESAAGAVAPDSTSMMPGAMPDSALLAGDIPRLFGTVVAPGGTRALLQLDLASGPRLLGVGDREGGFTVVSIAPREVVLRGPGGRRVLRLTSPEDRP